MPARFSSMICPSTPILSCKASHRARNRSRAVEERQATKGTKEKLNKPKSRSVDNSR